MPFQVQSARVANSHSIALRLSIAPDFAVPATYDIASYVVSGPASPVLRLVREIEGEVNLLFTAPLTEGAYTIVVGPSVQAVGAQFVDPSANSAASNGIKYPVLAHYLNATSVQVWLSQAIVATPSRTNPLSYSVTDSSGPVTVTSVTAIGSQQVTLRLAAPIVGSFQVVVQGLTTVTGYPFEGTCSGSAVPPKKEFSVKLSQFTGEVSKAVTRPSESPKETLTMQEGLSIVLNRCRYDENPVVGSGPVGRESIEVTENLRLEGGWQMVGLSLVPAGTGHSVGLTQTVQASALLRNPAQTGTTSDHEVVVAESFGLHEGLLLTPELRGPLTEEQKALFGNPNGLVFLSPSLTNSANSTIQVDDIQACTRAYEVYQIPPDPLPKKTLRTYGPASAISRLNQDVLTRGSITRSSGPVVLLSLLLPESTEEAQDIGASVAIVETYPPARMSLLNSPSWATSGAVPPALPKYLFKTADNSAPLPAPVAAPSLYFVNPGEVIAFSEALSLIQVGALGVVDSMSAGLELLDLSPGENVVQVNLGDTLTLGETLPLPEVGIHLSEVVSQSVGLVLS